MNAPAAGMPADIAALDLAALDDVQFQSVWRGMTPEEKHRHADGFARYKKITSYVDTGIARLERAERGADVLDARPRAIPLDWTDLAKQAPPERVWAMLWWIAFTATLFVGSGGAGKTQILMQLGACLSLAHRFIDEIPKALTVLMWCTEDDRNELWRRMVAIAQWIGADLEDFAGRFFLVPRVGLDNTLFTSEFGRPLWTPAFEELRQQAGDCGAQVVMLDNSAQLYGGNENDRHLVTTFINGLLGAHSDRAVILAAHPSRQAGSEFSGSSAWENAVRTRLYLGRTLPDQPQADDDEADDAVRYLSRRKSNYSPRDWRRFTFQNGVLVPDEVETGGMVDHIRKQRAGRVVLDAARRLHEMQVRMTDGTTSPNYLPKLVLDYKLGEGCTRKELSDAMRAAMLDGTLARGVVGRYSNRSPMNGLVVK